MALQTKTISLGDYAWKSWSNGYVISLTLTEEETDVAANTSLVSYLFTISNTNNNRFIANYNSWTISVGGQTIAINNFHFNLGSNYTTQTIASGQVTVAHNADGKLDMPYDVSIPNIQSWNEYGPPAMSISGVWTLTPILRTASISCPVGTIGNPMVISIHKTDESLSHTVIYQFGNLEGVVAEDTQETEILWTIPTTFYTQIPDAKRGSGTLICRNYNGETLVGETSCQFYADIDEEACRPVLIPEIVDENDRTVALTGDSRVLIRYYSDARITAEYFGRYGATVESYTMFHNGKTYTADDVLAEGVENDTFVFTVTDSRGVSNQFSVERILIPYVKLTCNLAAGKPDADGNMILSVSGNFFDGYFGDVNNSLTVQYRYKRSDEYWADDEDGWQDAQHTIDGNSYTATEVLADLDYQKAYTFQARAIDELAVVNSTEYTARAMPVFDWGETDFSIHGDLQVDGTVSVAGTPVLNTPDVRTYCWYTSGGVSLDSVADFLATCTSDCAFVTVIRGSSPPYVGMAIGAVYGNGKYGAVTLFDCLHGVQSRRVYDGVFYET